MLDRRREWSFRRSPYGGARASAPIRAALSATVANAREAYERARVLPRLIAIDPRELESAGEQLDAHIRKRLAKALRMERARGRAGHWTYDLNRHLALAQALAAETARKTPPVATGRRLQKLD